MKIKFLILMVFLFSGLVAAHPFKHGELVMDVYREGVKNGSDIIMYSPHGGDNQNFIYSNGSIKLASNQNYCIDVIRRDGDDNGRVILWECHGGRNQKFTINDNFILPYDNPNECLTVTEQKYIRSETCSFSFAQKFSIPKVCAYKDSNYRNLTECSNEDVSLVKSNDTMSSLSVVNASGVLYEHKGFEGEAMAFQKNLPSVRELNDKVSSFKVSSQRSFLITSDPQLVCQKNCGGISAEESKGNISSQYDMFNKFHANADAVLINGDLTEFGHRWEWRDFTDLLGKLKLPYYYGLGNHDMYNNYNDCADNSCVIRSITKLYHHVSSSDSVYDFDVNYTHGYVFPEVKETIKGSLSYAVDFGDVLVVQLNDYEKKINPLKINEYTSGWTGDLGMMRYEIERYQEPTYSWLERQLYSAYMKRQIVVVNQHRHDADAGNLKALLDKYNVQLRFSGHYHKLIGERRNGFWLSGSSALGTYLKLEVNHGKSVARIYKGEGNNANPDLIDVVELDFPKDILPPPPGKTYIRVKTSGGYEAFVSLIYRDENGVRKTINSGKLLEGNSWEYNVPSGSTIEYLEAKNNTGLVWEPQRRIFKINNIKNDSCFSMWGTTLNSAWQQVGCR